MSKLKPKQLNLTKENMVDIISQETGLPKDMVQRIILFLNFALYTKDGKLTNFAKEYDIKGYKDFYNFLKETKQLYKTDHEIEAFSNRYNTMFKSLLPRVSAWIFNTFVKFEKDMDTTDKYITSNLYASSFINRTFGQIMENLRVLESVVSAMDKAKKEVGKFVEGLSYQPNKK